MKRWSRVVPFESQKKQEEVWVCKDAQTQKRYNVEVTFGKPVDILSLKLNMVEEFKANVARIRDSRVALFKKGNLQRSTYARSVAIRQSRCRRFFVFTGQDISTVKNAAIILSRTYRQKNLWGIFIQMTSATKVLMPTKKLLKLGSSRWQCRKQNGWSGNLSGSTAESRKPFLI